MPMRADTPGMWGPIEYEVHWWDIDGDGGGERHFGIDWIAAEDFYEAKATNGGGAALHQFRRRVMAPVGRYAIANKEPTNAE